MTMTLDDLITTLEELRDEINGELSDGATDEAEVRLAIQPSYPMQHTVSDVVWVVEDEDAEVPKVVVYLAEGGQVSSAPYLPGNVASALDWR